MAKDADKGKRRPRQVRDDEARLFEAAMRDVERLPGRTAEAPADPDTASRPASSNRAVPPPPPPSRLASMPELRPGVAADLDARTMERLRRGRMRPEARLDLHGMTQDEAHRALTGFIAASRGAGRRCVIVITGRGRAKLGGGVLREQAPRWLNQQPTRGNILGFAEAQPKDGGAGALYVLLRKKRP
jgi:DNA-nicking Smr family endonuclease